MRRTRNRVSVPASRKALPLVSGSNMKACANSKYVAFERIVYSLATRCPLCKWDLRLIRPAGDAKRSVKAAGDFEQQASDRVKHGRSSTFQYLHSTNPNARG